MTIENYIPPIFFKRIKYWVRKLWWYKLAGRCKAVTRRDGAKYFLPDNYQSRTNPCFDDHELITSTDIVWQPDVYSLALILARATGSTHILDIGCGHGVKLNAFSPEFQLIGVDTADNIRWCNENYNHGTWLSMNLESEAPLLPPEAIGSMVMICSDVIEHIVDAKSFVEKLAGLLDSCHLGVISTPDRSFHDPHLHCSPPVNPNHVREWCADELQKLLESAHMEARTYLTRTNTKTGDRHTVLAIVQKGRG